MNKLPAIQFYPGDWRKDPGVQALDFYDRGVWLEMLFLMHESAQRGRLLLNNKPMPEDALARILGINPLRVQETVNKLLAYGVASRDDQGVIFCRRMVRDEMLRNEAAEAGRQGGNPSLGSDYNRAGFVYALQRASDGKIKIGIGDNPSRRLYKIRNKEKVAVEMLAMMHVDDMRKTVESLQKEFTEEGSFEWFSLSQTDIETLKDALKGKKKGTPTASYEDEDEDEDEVVLNCSSESSRKKPHPGKFDAEFYRWWDEAVWHKVGKSKAKEEYVKARKGGASEEVLFRSAKEQGPQIISTAERTGGTPLYPSTWLHNRRWEDEIVLFPAPNGRTPGWGNNSYCDQEYVEVPEFT